MAGVTAEVLAEGEIEPEECVVKIASLLRYVSIPVCAAVYSKAFAYIQKSELISFWNRTHRLSLVFAVCATL